jgi:hypothetical protein
MKGWAVMESLAALAAVSAGWESALLAVTFFTGVLPPIELHVIGLIGLTLAVLGILPPRSSTSATGEERLRRFRKDLGRPDRW